MPTDAVIIVITISSLIAALVLCTVSWKKSKKKLLDPVGSGGWDFGQSWASNLGAVGSILGVVVGSLSGLPASDLGAAVVLMSVFFGAAVLLGPIIYGALAQSLTDGTILGFYLSNVFVLWAACGEVTAAAAFFLSLGSKIPQLIEWAFVVVAVIALAALGTYAWRTMGWVAAKAGTKQPLGPGDRNWHFL